MKLDDGSGRSLTIERVGSGPVLVCLPGGPGFAAGHLGTLGGLDDRFELVLIDTRGAGESDPPSDGVYSIDAYAADVDLVRESLGFETIILFGHSHGGLVAARYAATYPHRVDAVVLDGTPLRVRDVQPPEAGMRGYFADWDGHGEQYVEQHVSNQWTPAGEYFWEHEAVDVDLTDDLRRIGARCLVIYGEADFVTGRAVAEEMNELLAAGHVVEVPGAGHFAWVEAPREYAAAIAAFAGAAS